MTAVARWVRRWQNDLAVMFDPAVRHERRRRRARRSLAVRSVVTIGLAWIASVVGASPGIELGEVFWGSVAAIGAVSTVSAGRKVWRLERGPRPLRAAAPPPLPPPGSAARQPLERLASRERALGDLLTVLGPAAGDVGADAAVAAAALRAHAGRLITVESARNGAPAEARAGLDSALAALRQQLEEGVSAYDRMVTAAADAVSAHTSGAGDGMASGMLRLEDASDALLGLARGLREVSGNSGG